MYAWLIFTISHHCAFRRHGDSVKLDSVTLLSRNVRNARDVTRQMRYVCMYKLLWTITVTGIFGLFGY